jgi:hypothetical protein
MNDNVEVAEEVAASLSEPAGKCQKSIPGAKFKAYLYVGI